MHKLFDKHILVLTDEDNFTVSLGENIERMSGSDSGVKLHSVDDPDVVQKAAYQNFYCALIAFKTCYDAKNDEAIIQYRRQNPNSPIILINNAKTISLFDCSDELLEALPKRVSRRLLKVDARQAALSLISLLNIFSHHGSQELRVERRFVDRLAECV